MANVKAISSLGLKLLAGPDKDSLTELCRIKDFPDLKGTPNNLECTDLQDEQQAFIAGILQSDTKTFTANFVPEVYDRIESMERQEMLFALLLKGTAGGFVFPGQFTLGIPGKGVDEVLDMTINITSSGDVVRDKSVTEKTIP